MAQIVQECFPRQFTHHCLSLLSPFLLLYYLQVPTHDAGPGVLSAPSVVQLLQSFPQNWVLHLLGLSEVRERERERDNYGILIDAVFVFLFSAQTNRLGSD